MINSNIRLTYHALQGVSKKISKSAQLSDLVINKRNPIKDFIRETGWIDYFYFSFSENDVKVKMNYNGIDVEYSAEDLYNRGDTVPNEFGLYVSKYDATNSLFTIAFYPTVPMSFKTGLSFEYQKTSAGTYNLLNYRIECFVISSAEKYLRSVMNPFKSLWKNIIKKE